MAKSKFTCECTTIHSGAVQEVREKMEPEERYQQTAWIFKILADPTRMKIIWALDQRELCVCDLSSLLGMTKSAVSHQLATLRRAKLVRFRRSGKEVFYTLADGHIRSILEAGMEHSKE